MENMSRVNRKQQHPSSKKAKWPFLLLLLVLLIVGGGTYWFIHKTQVAKAYQEQQTTLIKNLQEEMAESGIALKEEKSGNDYLYLPKENNELSKELTKQINDLLPKGKEALGSKKGTVVGYVAIHHITDQLTEYLPAVRTYTWNNLKKEYTKKELKGKDVTYIKQSTQQKITALDLFPEAADYQGFFTVLQQKILDTSKDGKKIIDDVLNMTPPTQKDLRFTYSNDGLAVDLGENPTGVKKVTIPFKDIAGYIDPSLVDPAKLDLKKTTFDPKKKYIALTFDDGPGAETTPQLLKTLKEKNVKATFFNLGQNAKDNPEILKQIIKDGHHLANHSWDHPELTTLSKEAVEKQIRETNKVLYLATGKLPPYVRPPYGAVNKTTGEAIGLPVIQWNIDSSDWALKDAKKIENNVLKMAFNGGIILLHDIHQFSVDAVPGIIDGLRKQGYEFINLDEMLGYTKPLYQYFGLYNGKVDGRLIK